MNSNIGSRQIHISIRSICCIGAGYVGGPTMAVIADRCPNVKVTVVDIDSQRIKAWNETDLSKLPVYEPGLDQVIKRVRGKNLFFSTNLQPAIASADLVFISVNTPTKTTGIGAGQASDLSWAENCARQVSKFATGHTIVVEKSTVPVRTAEVIETILESGQNRKERETSAATFSVLSNPEFLAEGTAIRDLESPDRVLIGGSDINATESLAEIYRNWVLDEKILKTNLWSSELSKLIANAFLAQRISSINSVSALCEVTGADVNEVAKAIGTDSRIGAKFLSAGPGFGGSCFKKDILNLVYISNYFGLPEVASYWKSVIDLNTWQKSRISNLVVKKLFGTVRGKRIVILGFSFKSNTNDTRESPSIDIAKELIEEGANLFIHDPQVSSSRIQEDLGLENYYYKVNTNSAELAFVDKGTWAVSDDIYLAAKEADAILVLTEWPEYTKIDWGLISSNMRHPSWVFDARCIVNEENVKKAGLEFWCIGSGS